MQVTQGKVLNLRTEQVRFIDGITRRFDFGELKLLAADIKANGGNHEPIKVLKTKDKTPGGLPIYELIEGDRRVQATTMANKGIKDDADLIWLTALEAPAGTTKKDILIERLSTGQGKLNPNMLEKAYWIKDLLDSGMKQADIAKSTGTTQPHVADCLMLLKAPEENLQQVRDGAIAASALVEMLKSGEVKEVGEAVTKAVDKAKAEGKAKVTTKDVEKTAGKPMTKKSAAKASTKKGVPETSGPAVKEKKVEKTSGMLYQLRDAILSQADADPIPYAMRVLTGVIGFVEGKYEIVDLSDLFFDAEAELPEAKEDTAAEAPKATATTGKGSALRNILNGAPEAPAKKTAAKKTATATKATVKSAAKPPQDEDDFDDAATTAALGNGAPASAIVDEDDFE